MRQACVHSLASLGSESSSTGLGVATYRTYRYLHSTCLRLQPAARGAATDRAACLLAAMEFIKTRMDSAPTDSVAHLEELPDDFLERIATDSGKERQRSIVDARATLRFAVASSVLRSRLQVVTAVCSLSQVWMWMLVH